jgi:putative flippase GtrA
MIREHQRKRWTALSQPDWGIVRQFLSFCLVGIANTLLGYSIIFSSMYWLGLAPVKSNILGYAIVLIFSFLLNKYYVFKRKERIPGQFRLFLISFALSYLSNLAALKLALLLFYPYASQVFAGAVYTGSSFVLYKYLVFEK